MALNLCFNHLVLSTFRQCRSAILQRSAKAHNQYPPHSTGPSEKPLVYRDYAHFHYTINGIHDVMYNSTCILSPGNLAKISSIFLIYLSSIRQLTCEWSESSLATLEVMSKFCCQNPTLGSQSTPNSSRSSLQPGRPSRAIVLFAQRSIKSFAAMDGSSQWMRYAKSF